MSNGTQIIHSTNMSSQCPTELIEATHILAACYSDTHDGQLTSDLGDNTVMANIQKCIEQNRKLLCQAKVGLVEAAMLSAHKTTCVCAWNGLQDARLRLHIQTSTNDARCAPDLDEDAHGDHGGTRTTDGPRIFVDPLFSSSRLTDNIEHANGSNTKEMPSANSVYATGHGRAWQEAPTVIVGGHGHRGAVLVRVCGNCEHEAHRHRSGDDGGDAKQS
ncbi:hypothetical protein CONPUDRAFT_164433 [Coniophora puteana RWD-64-598 SS2]|uniref:Uncharacterized protein n=1 Tax=Coniophora puteana (strain RWD-64-598) TaxID=741705 RepID=A0A5M3MXQ2_CONPW|nr:uncharacterized protein CONPUDRAFT_164433 [Coniophora puteana RWD-64-598 SS2]EIW83505.1 hypothetical protein CONPUDRAFT_164433 [Coniophora puteana RWD-64-598 SS2]